MSYKNWKRQEIKPTQTIKLSIVLSVDAYEKLIELSSNKGTSASGVINSLLNQC